VGPFGLRAAFLPREAARCRGAGSSVGVSSNPIVVVGILVPGVLAVVLILVSIDHPHDRSAPPTATGKKPVIDQRIARGGVVIIRQARHTLTQQRHHRAVADGGAIFGGKGKDQVGQTVGHGAGALAKGACFPEDYRASLCFARPIPPIRRGKANYREALFLAYGSGTETLLSGYVEDMHAVLKAFLAMAGAFARRKLGKDLWSEFVADVDAKKAFTTRAGEIWT
jgi:hypothetical protein